MMKNLTKKRALLFPIFLLEFASENYILMRNESQQPSYTLNSVPTLSRIQCASLCTSDPRCQTFNSIRSSSLKSYQCDLLELFDIDELVQANRSRVYIKTSSLVVY